MDIYWLWLSGLPYVGPMTSKKLLQTFANPKDIYEADAQKLRSVKGLSKRAIESILSARSLEKSKRLLEKLQKQNIKLLTCYDPRYPEHAKDIPDSPVLLYYIGEIASFQEAAAVVGSRRCTDYGKRVASHLATQLAQNNVPVISGLAKGIDSYAHTACLKEQGYTIAFLASGVDICYPREHQALYEQICENGAVISEYPPSSAPIPQRFLERNRLISGWATNVIIVEAGKKSGALTTAEYANKQGKRLFAVPHRIDAPEGKGTNRLLRDGATPYLELTSLELKLNKRLINVERPELVGLNEEERKILEQLEGRSVSVPELAYKLQLPLSELREKLFTLELEDRLYMRGDVVTMKK